MPPSMLDNQSVADLLMIQKMLPELQDRAGRHKMLAYLLAVAAAEVEAELRKELLSFSPSDR